MKQKLAIIGAGLSGVVAANLLKEHFAITIFEKARGVGGRMSTRRAEPYQFDHGAQFFTARSKEFQSYLKPHIESGLVTEWNAKLVTLEKGEKPFKRQWFEPHYVATPRMNSLCKYLAEGIETSIQIEIASMSYDSDKWCLHDKDGRDWAGFDFVISAVPSHQAANILPNDLPFHSAIASAKMLGCHSIMLGFEEMPKLNWDIAIPKNSPISWIAKNSTKPSRETAPSIIIQTDNTWSEEHIEDDVELVQQKIIAEFCEISGMDESQIVHKQTHRWRYSSTAESAGEEFFIDPSQKIAACGDWCGEGKVESAFQSARRLSSYIINNII